MKQRVNLLFIVLVAAVMTACGGGGGSMPPPITALGSTTIASTTPTPVSTTPAPTSTTAMSSSTSAATYPATSSTTAAVGTSAQTVSFSSVVGSGYSATIGIPATSSGSGSVTLSLSAGAANLPPLQSIRRRAQDLGIAALGIEYLSFTPAATISFATTPSFVFTLASGFSLPVGTTTYVALYYPGAGWVNFLGPVLSVGGDTFAFASVTDTLTFQAGLTYGFAWWTATGLNP